MFPPLLPIIPLCLRPPPMPPPSSPALMGNPPMPALPGKPSLLALGGAPIMPSLRPPLFMEPAPSAVPGGLPKREETPGGAPSALRIISFMRMYWYLERCGTCV